ncbi:Protein of unknown function [Cotesia congregata]|uniref:Uncharacterized protein n=1 Tax=Cotesia congregata TaxID=51543 RepID=A0A8J2HG82_COTCN|nr:Protein of unknown function [Cotesia congregata]
MRWLMQSPRSQQTASTSSGRSPAVPWRRENHGVARSRIFPLYQTQRSDEEELKKTDQAKEDQPADSTADTASTTAELDSTAVSGESRADGAEVEDLEGINRGDGDKVRRQEATSRSWSGVKD